MSLIDTTFASIPAGIIDDWGQTMTYVKTTTPRVYDPSSGNTEGIDRTVTLKGVIMQINSRELDGLYQTTDLKIIIGTQELGTYYPTEADRIRYTQNDVNREAKILNVTTYRGDNPVLHTLIVRPQ